MRIALHALVLETTRQPADRIRDVLVSRFPNSLITSSRNIRHTQRLLRENVFDLVVLVLSPLRKSHKQLLSRLCDHTTPMPTVLIVGPGHEEELYQLLPEMPSNWEITSGEGLSGSVIAHRIYKAIDNHQRRWELNHIQQAFQSSLLQYRNLFDEVPDLIFLCDRSGCLLDVNATATRLFGQPKERLLMRPIFETFGMGRDDFDQLLARALSSQTPIEDFEIEFRPQGRRTVYGLTHLIRWQNGDGRPLQFQGVIKDISPHKRLERKLRQSEDKYKTLYELARISSASLHLDDVAEQSLALIHRCCNAGGTLLLLNRHYEQLNFIEAINFPIDLRKRFEQEFPPRIGRDLIGRWAITPGIHSIPNSHFEGLHPVIADWMKRQAPCHLFGVPLGRENPTMPSTILLMTIAGEQAETLDEDMLGGLSQTLEMGISNCFHYANSLEAENRYRELWENAPALFVSVLKGGVIFEINHTAANALGYSLSDLIGQPIQKFIAKDDVDAFIQRHRRVVEQRRSQSHELRLLCRNGEAMTVSVRSEPLTNGDGDVIGEKSVMHDITRDKQLEAQLRDYAMNLSKKVEERTTELTQTMNFLNGILEGSTEYAIVGLDEAGRFLHFNRGAQLLFGHQAEDMVGRHTIQRLLDMENAPFESLAEMLREVEEKGVLVQQLPMLTADGMSLIALLTINYLKSSAAGNLTYVAIIRDITEQKELEDLLKLYTENLQQVIEQKSRELDRQHVQLIQSSKLATLGEMATGIAHELNQPLSGIRTRAQIIKKAIEKGMSNQTYVDRSQDEIIQLVDRITHIIHHMRIFARQDQQAYTPFAISESIDGALSLLGQQLRIHAIEVEKQIQPDLPKLFGEPLQIEQVLLNLLSNARDALDCRAEIQREHGHEITPKRLYIRAMKDDNSEMRLEIEDNGIGMNQEVQEKIFEPFFTTKPVGRGTGLGMSISYGILTSHNGRIDVQSEAEQGTCFRIWLPLCKPHGKNSPPNASQAQHP